MLASQTVPPAASMTLATKALPSGFDVAGALLAVAVLPDPGCGMVMSMGVTWPTALSCLSKSADFPTTSTASFSLPRYFLATRSTSAAVTFSTPF